MVARNYISPGSTTLLTEKKIADEIKILLITTIAFLTDDLKPSKPRENNVFNVLQTRIPLNNFGRAKSLLYLHINLGLQQQRSL
jgi:hypothetical protein